MRKSVIAILLCIFALPANAFQLKGEGVKTPEFCASVKESADMYLLLHKTNAGLLGPKNSEAKQSLLKEDIKAYLQMLINYSHIYNAWCK